MKRIRALLHHVGLGPSPWLLTLSVFAFSTIIFFPEDENTIKMCGGSGVSIIAFLENVGTMPLEWSPIRLGFDWFLMCVAMMSPLIAQQVAYAQWSVARPYRLSSTFLVLIAYLSTWTMTGVLLISLSFLLVVIVGINSSLLLIVIVSILWSASPLAQIFRNKCHKNMRMNGFGFYALKDSVEIGLKNGLYCFLACWPWMMLPGLIDDAHIAAMILVALYLYADRIAPATRPRWKTPPAIETFFGTRIMTQRRFIRKAFYFQRHEIRDFDSINVKSG